MSVKVVKLGDGSLPPSLPLVIHSNMMDKNLLLYLPDDNSSEEGENESESQGPSLKVVPETLEVLKSIEKPIAFVSICGPFRTGKSYLLSHILGRPGAFKVGHEMGACTKGIWMATSVLEFDDHVLVLLDTEGMDSPDDDSADVSKLLIVTTLLSSLLIYNSQTAPDWKDLEDLSCFSHLSSLIATKGLSVELYDRMSDNFPHFLWLVRDALKLPLIDGKQTSPTEYLKTRVLVRSNSRKSTHRDEIVGAILRLFPSVECRTLPRPSADPNIVTSMEQKYDLLEPAFKEALASLVDHIRRNVKVKTMHCNNGIIWAEMVTERVSSVNSDKEIQLDNMYIVAAETTLSKLSQRFVTEYKKEMEESVQHKYPMEEDEGVFGQKETLLSIHNRIVVPKLAMFQREVDHFLPASNEDDSSVEEKKQSLLLSFQEEICQQSTEGAVIAGALHRFTVENYKASRHSCQKVELTVFRSVRQKLQDAVTKHAVVDISLELTAAEEKYFQLAIGPAKHEVYSELRQSLPDSSLDLIKTLPGRPKDLRFTFAANKKIELSWVETNSNRKVVNFYEVQKMSGAAKCTILSQHFPDQHATIENLKSNTVYQFQVRGVGVTGILGNWSDTCTCSTTVGMATRSAATFGSFVGGMFAAPVAGLLVLGPLGIVGVVGGPILGGVLAKQVNKHFGPRGQPRTSSSGEDALEESIPPAVNDLVSAEGSIQYASDTGSRIITDSDD